jgi:signal transduction histidine kinase
LYGRAGRYEGRLIALNDITERKAAEQERERLLAELDAFAHTVAHDLRTPLTALIGYSSILEAGLEQLPPSEIKRFAHAIGRSSRKMTDIIEALLLLASVRQMDQVQVVPLDMAAIVAEVHHRLSEVTTEYRAQITGPEAWPVALGYAPWIEEVWTNYLINAIKYGGTPPCVELGAAILPDGMIRFWVRDNGYGLTLDQQGQLFVPFARLHQVKAKGYGLGLSIVKRIVEKMGGQVSITSEIGQGSEFSFTLPPAPPNGQG